MTRKRKYIPYVVEPSLGVDRVTLAFLCSAYEEEELENGETRTVLRFHKALAPVKIMFDHYLKAFKAYGRNIYEIKQIL